jgi:hypothetical protein
LGESDAGTDAAVEEFDAAAEFVNCDDDDPSALPDSLVCTGLYASLLDQRFADSVIEFKPAFPLWSDGAVKRRWIYLPEGEKIDNSDPNGWVFPVGTKLWKEFSVNNKRVETRLFWKVRSDLWRKGTFRWNEDDTEATSSFGGDIKLKDGSTYHLPTGEECEDCHKGQPDFVLGFSAVNLGLEGAEGVTLEQLVKDGLLTKRPTITQLSIGADETGLDDDGIPLVAKVLPMLHTNCGQTCHNNTPAAKANLSHQNLRLDSTLLDGRSPDDMFNVLRTAVNQRAEGEQWNNHPFRILPGDPENSLIYQLMNYRDPTGQGRGQMPPIATRKIDDAGVALLEKWIRALAAGTPAVVDAGPAIDASMEEAGAEMDAGMDAATPLDAEPAPAMDASADGEIDAGSDAGVDAGSDAVDAGIDAEVDAGTVDAEVDANSSDDAEASDDAAEANLPDSGDADDDADTDI